MTRKPIIAVDVDLTVVDSLTPWLQWFTQQTGLVYDPTISGQFDLVPTMLAMCEAHGVKGFDPFAYWHRPDLYDDMSTLGDSIAILTELVDMGAEVGFISHCVPAHEDSKQAFIKRNFGHLEPFFISTKDKGLVEYDMLIDDNTEILARAIQRRPKATHIMFNEINKWCKPMDLHVMKAWDETGATMLRRQLNFIKYPARTIMRDLPACFVE